jgi:hypothetical protein
MTRRVLVSAVLAAGTIAPGWCAPKTSWNKVYYVGGTVDVKSGNYDWNTTITITAKEITIAVNATTIFSSGQTLRLKPSQITSIWFGPSAWLRVSEVPGAKLPPKPPSLFGMMAASADFASLGILFETPDGKRGAVLIESAYTGAIIVALKNATGKPIENSP